jgi:hypothetical protein
MAYITDNQKLILSIDVLRMVENRNNDRLQQPSLEFGKIIDEMIKKIFKAKKIYKFTDEWSEILYFDCVRKIMTSLPKYNLNKYVEAKKKNGILTEANHQTGIYNYLILIIHSQIYDTRARLFNKINSEIKTTDIDFEYDDGQSIEIVDINWFDDFEDAEKKIDQYFHEREKNG